MADLVFLSIEDVMRIQERVLARDGGLAGVRDLGLLSAAVMMPQQGFGGAYLHEDLAAMAAAYLYHISKNHPFLDGNKRAALAAALTFLIANGVSSLPTENDAAETTLAVAAGQMSKDELTLWFRRAIG
jgi:death-on-curing protein